MNFKKFFLLVLVALVSGLFAQDGELGSSYYKNYGEDRYSRKEVDSQKKGLYDYFGNKLFDGMTVYEMYNDRQSYGLSDNTSYDSTVSSLSQQKAYEDYFGNFQNLVVTRDAIGGTKTSFVYGTRIQTRFTPFTLNKLNFNGFRWDVWTSGIKFTALASRTRPGAVSLAGRGGTGMDVMAPVTYPLREGSFVGSGLGSSFDWKTIDDLKTNYKNRVDYSNKSPYGDYDFLWSFHAENDLANVLQYGITYMNHHRSDIKKGEKFHGEIPDAMAPEEIHFEFYDMTYDRTDDAGCYVEYVRMKVNGVDAGGPSSVYSINNDDKMLFVVGLPRVQNGEVPTVATFHPLKPTILHNFKKSEIKHITFEYKVAGNYLVFVSTDKFVPLAIRSFTNAPITDDSRVVVYAEPYSRAVDDIYGAHVPVNSNSTLSGSEGTVYFGDYIAKAPKLVEPVVSVGGAMPNARVYTYEYTVDANSETFGVNFKGKLAGVNFSGEFASNVKEGKYPGEKNNIDDYSNTAVRRNVFQLKADRDLFKKFNLGAEYYYVAPDWGTNLKIPQPSRYISKTQLFFPLSAEMGDRGKIDLQTDTYDDYLVYPMPMSNDWRSVDDNEDGDIYAENSRAQFSTEGSMDDFHYDGTQRYKHYKGQTLVDTVPLPTGLSMIYDDKNGVVSQKYDQNENGTPDYYEDFRVYYVDPPVFDLGYDMNFNGVADNEDDDILPEYPYALPYTITSSGIKTHGITGFSAKLSIAPTENMDFNIGVKSEKAVNMNFAEHGDADGPSSREGKSSLLFADGKLVVNRRAQGVRYLLGGEFYYVKDAIRNDVVLTGTELDVSKNISYAYHYVTDPLRYQNAIVNNFVASLEYSGIRNFDYAARVLLGMEEHMAIAEKLYITKTRADYTYESFWESYPSRRILKSYFINKLGYTQKWSVEYDGWKSVFNLLNRFSIMPQYKLSYEFKKNVLNSVENIDPRTLEKYKTSSNLTDSDLSEFVNLWGEYSANTKDFILSVPILLCNFKVAENTVLNTGIEWMRAFDRVTQTASFGKTRKIAQVVSKYNYQGYNVALLIGFDVVDQTWDLNYFDSVLKTGSAFNVSNSEFFARIYAGVD